MNGVVVVGVVVVDVVVVEAAGFFFGLAFGPTRTILGSAR